MIKAQKLEHEGKLAEIVGEGVITLTTNMGGCKNRRETVQSPAIMLGVTHNAGKLFWEHSSNARNRRVPETNS